MTPRRKLSSKEATCINRMNNGGADIEQIMEAVDRCRSTIEKYLTNKHYNEQRKNK